MVQRPLTREMIAEFKHILSDGGWGSEMQKKGGKRGECFEAWNLDNPDKVFDAAKQRNRVKS